MSFFLTLVWMGGLFVDRGSLRRELLWPYYLGRHLASQIKH